MHLRSAILAEKILYQQSIWVPVKHAHLRLIHQLFHSNCYFPPESELSPSIITELFHILTTTKHDALIMTGDFNYSDIDWRDRSYQNESQKLLLDFAERKNLEQEVTFNTTVSGIYDLFFISRKIELQDIPIAEEFVGVKSNHEPIWSVFTVRGHENKFKSDNSSEFLSYCKADYPRIEEIIIKTRLKHFAGPILTN